ncbi:MAG: ribonuclease R [Pseudomonadota bacterium]
MPKRRIPKPRLPPRFTATEIREVIEQAGTALDWRSLIERLQVDDPRAITQVRQLLKGLLRNGDIKQDHQGAYHAANPASTEDVTLAAVGRDLYAGEYALGVSQRQVLREGDRVQVVIQDGYARVVELLEPSSKPVLGIVRAYGRRPYVEGVGQYRGKVSLIDLPAGVSNGDTVSVNIVGGNLQRLHGVIADIKADQTVAQRAIEAAIGSFDLPHTWPLAVQRAAEELPKRVNKGQYPKRVDLTGLPLVTIDGETAKDFDDAVYAEPLKGRNPGVRLLVAIADVGHYVKPGSVLDDEAQLRGTSVYFPDHVIPMLPEAISNGLCSLRPNEHRLSMVCDMRIDAVGQVAKYDFYEAVIHSHARLTYNQVQHFLDHGTLDADTLDHAAVTASLEELHRTYTILRQAREQRGALDFPVREGALHLEAGAVARITPMERVDAHMLIEEAMILANVCAAMFLEKHSTPGLYRVHEPPDPTKLDDLRQMLAGAGVKLAPGDVAPAVLQSALARLPQHADPWLYGQLALRTLKQAIYTPDNKGHYGLALERYMHFTSPIRRYPDLVVHRAIKAVLSRRAKPAKKVNITAGDALLALGEQCSNHERRAESAGWLVEGWLKCEYLRQFQDETLEGVVAAVLEFGLFVELKGFYVQGLLHISNLGQDYFEFSPRAMALIGERSGRKFRLGDELAVVVRDIDPPQGKIDLLLPGQRESGRRRGGRGTDERSVRDRDRGRGRRR